MRHLLALLLLATSLCATKGDDCLDDITVVTKNGWSFTVAHTEGFEGTCWNAAVTYTNLTCHELVASGGCQWPFTPSGTFLCFNSGTNCSASAVDVATVSYSCHTNIVCAQSQGGPLYCGNGGTFTISIGTGVQAFCAVLVPGQNHCCSMTWCEISGTRNTCIPQAPHGDP